MRSLEIILDHLPYTELSPNSRVHWAVKSRAVKALREEIGWLGKSEWHDQKPMMHAKITYEFQFKDNRKHDMDNLTGAMCKPIPDGLIDAGVIFYDDSKHLSYGEPTASVTGVERTIVRLVEISG